ncbi:MAG: GNAT family N-acetyltransferase [Lentilitoribacter sp.]
MSKSPEPLSTVVTLLEMNKPHVKSFTRPMNINAALMGTQNIPLHFYRYLQYRVGSKWHWVSRHRLSNDQLSAIIHAETTEIDVLYLDGVPSGFFEIDRSNAKRVDLAYFGMMEHAIGRGLGKWFLAQAIDAAWSSEPEAITVNTCTLDHPSALGLYQKLGFQPIGRTETEIMPLSENEILATLK